MNSSAQYQPCRWYDPYPRLAFALKLLYLAPMWLREEALGELMGFLESELGETVLGVETFGLDLSQEAPLPGERAAGERWYDHLYRTHAAIEALRRSPDSLKGRSAEMLLNVLTR